MFQVNIRGLKVTFQPAGIVICLLSELRQPRAVTFVKNQ